MNQNNFTNVRVGRIVCIADPESPVPDLQSDVSKKIIKEYSDALNLNKTADNALKEIENKLLDRLNVCRQKLAKVQHLINYCESNPPQSNRKALFKYYHCGIPFFKDRNFFPAPPNSDTTVLKFNGVTNNFHTGSRSAWTSIQKKELLKEITKQARDKRKIQLSIQKKNLEKVILSCKAVKHEKEDDKDFLKHQNDLKELINQLENVKSVPLTELVLPLSEKEEFDWDIMELNSIIRHKAAECRSMWRMFLHPSLYKGVWGRREQYALAILAQRMRKQNWENIAQRLGSRRSSYQCFVQYRLHLAPRTLLTTRWSPEEDVYLRNVVNSCRIGDYIPWAKVSCYIENRTKDQIYARWVHQLCVNRRGRFTKEEDNVILAGIREYGCCFKRIAELLPGRSAVQVRLRYRSMEQYKKHIQWSYADDHQLYALVTHHRYYSNNINYSLIAKKFPNKTTNSVRQRFKTLEMFLQDNPNKGLSRAPRKNRISNYNLNHKMSLTEALEKYKLSCTNTTCKRESTENLQPVKVVYDRPTKIYSQFINYFTKDLTTETDPQNDCRPVEVNITELKMVLLFLGAKLDKKLINSTSFSLYPDLKKFANDLLSKNDINIPLKIKNIKTYSRKEIGCDSASAGLQQVPSPNIWESKVTGSNISSSYVLPPCYTTALAFKSIMLQKCSLGETFQSEFAEYKSSTISVPHLKTWWDRFEILFTWAANLSNISTNIKINIFDENNSSEISCKDSFVEDGQVKRLDELLQMDNTALTSIDDRLPVKRGNRKWIRYNTRENVSSNDESQNCVNPKSANKKYKDASSVNPNIVKSTTASLKKKLKTKQNSDFTIISNKKVPNTDITDSTLNTDAPILNGGNEDDQTCVEDLNKNSVKRKHDSQNITARKKLKILHNSYPTSASTNIPNINNEDSSCKIINEDATTIQNTGPAFKIIKKNANIKSSRSTYTIVNQNASSSLFNEVSSRLRRSERKRFK